MVVSTGGGAKVDGETPTPQPTTKTPTIGETVQSIKEIVRDCSEAEIIVALKEAYMDANETAQKLLNQEPFHEVKRKRNKNKENVGNKGPAEPTKNQPEVVDQGTKFSSSNRNNQKGVFNDKIDNGPNGENIQRGGLHQRGGFSHRGGHSQRGGYNQRGFGTQRGTGFQKGGNVQRVDDNQEGGYFNKADGKPRDNGDQRNDNFHIDGDFQRGDYQTRGGFQRGGSFRRGGSFQRGAYVRNSLPVKSREFRVVRDNRVNQNTTADVSALNQSLTSDGQDAGSNVSSKGNSSKTSKNQKVTGTGDFSEKANESKGPDERRALSQSTNARLQSGKSKDSRPRSAGQASNNSVLGLYSSSSDPVHVPSPARSSANGSFRREVGVVGGKKMPADNSGKQTSVNTASTKSNPSAESIKTQNISPKSNQLGAVGAALQGASISRPFSSHSHHGHRSHQQPAGHQKAVQNKEWKPKPSQRSLVSVGIVGMSSGSSSSPAEIITDSLKDSISDAGKLPDNLTLDGPHEIQGVIISEKIRVPDIERCGLTFGSFRRDTSLPNSVAGSEATVEYSGEISARMTGTAPEPSNIDVSVHESPESSASDAAADHQFSDARESSSPQHLESYAEIGMVRNDSTSYTHSDLQKHQEQFAMPSFAVYDSQTGYDMAYFRPPNDEAARGVGHPSVQEGLNSHATGMIPASQALYQQQAPVAQMYQQVHVSHYMPYRPPFMPPVYVPQMGMPGYTPNAAYAHPANGNGYVLVPGGSSHVNPNAMKYGAQQQFKPVSGGSPTGYGGSYATPNGYAVNAPGGIMGVAGLDDASRMKYKDGNGNIYVQNPQTMQAEAQEMWMQQNPREMPSSPYYNMQGQPPHGTYMQPQAGAYNPAAVAQSSHMQMQQFPGMYQAQAAPPIPSPHHMGPANVGVGVGVGVAPPVAPMGQVGAYQQPQMNHLQWQTSNF